MARGREGGGGGGEEEGRGGEEGRRTLVIIHPARERTQGQQALLAKRAKLLSYR